MSEQWSLSTSAPGSCTFFGGPCGLLGLFTTLIGEAWRHWAQDAPHLRLLQEPFEDVKTSFPPLLPFFLFLSFPVLPRDIE